MFRVFAIALLAFQFVSPYVIYKPRYNREDVPTVRLFENRNFKGGVLTMANVLGCINFDHTYFNDRISSVDSRGHCFYIYEDSYCQGKICRELWKIFPYNYHSSLTGNYIRVDYKGNTDLQRADFNDVASSIRSC